MIYVYAIVK